jgi:membrane carboxypeptidase/penicillin-binding protein
LGPNAFGGEAGARTWAAFMKPAMQGKPVMDFPVPGPLPAPRTDGLAEPARKRANQQSIGQFPTDCGGPCVKTPSLPAPATPTTQPPPTVPDSSSTTTTEKQGG